MNKNRPWVFLCVSVLSFALGASVIGAAADAPRPGGHTATPNRPGRR